NPSLGFICEIKTCTILCCTKFHQRSSLCINQSQEYTLRVHYSIHLHSWLYCDACPNPAQAIYDFECTATQYRCNILPLLLCRSLAHLRQKENEQHKIDHYKSNRN